MRERHCLHVANHDTFRLGLDAERQRPALEQLDRDTIKSNLTALMADIDKAIPLASKSSPSHSVTTQIADTATSEDGKAASASAAEEE